MLWTVVVILLVLWLLGFGLHVAGGLINILLVINQTAATGVRVARKLSHA